MPDSTAPAPANQPAATPPLPAPAAKPNAAPGFYNKGQLADIQAAEVILPATATAEAMAAFAKAKLPAGYVDGLKQMVREARDTISATGQAKVAKHAAAVSATGAELALLVSLQAIQAAAKMKKKLLEEDGDPATNFSTDGYLIGKRLNQSRTMLLQNADTLRTLAAQDDIGYEAADLAAVDGAVTAYSDDKSAQATVSLASDQEKLKRDAFIKKLNIRREVLMLAIERMYSYSDHTHDPIRKAFGLPLDRPFAPSH